MSDISPKRDDFLCLVVQAENYDRFMSRSIGLCTAPNDGDHPILYPKNIKVRETQKTFKKRKPFSEKVRSTNKEE